jgi:hypothetical protein
LFVIKNKKKRKFENIPLFAVHPIFQTSIYTCRDTEKESTGGAAMKAMMNTEVAVNNVGIMITPNQPSINGSQLM